MAKKELRLAVVIYGGASLAVYMHGVTKELIKLVRASKVLHEMGHAAAARSSYADGPDPRPPDTEAVYFEILKAINRTDDFRVVIDVIAGASAGAINGIMLAKALVDDARLDAQTPLWLDGADSEALAAETVGRWRKWYLYPMLRALSRWLPRDITESAETQRKLARLVRASWFRPPFSGERLCHLFFDGLAKLGATRRAGSSLLPPGQRLDVYASLTDLAGYPRTIRLNDGLVVREKEHAAFCRLSHVAGQFGGIGGNPGSESDFADENLPGLVWAARASSSYAGAFPPFRHDELLRVTAELGIAWPAEARFLADRLRTREDLPMSAELDPARRWFVDGGIVNNKPFGAVLEALNHRPADRQVCRRLLYVEPDPTLPATPDHERSLGYLGMLHAAASTIPRNQPILEELNAIVALDARVQVNRRVIESHRERIAEITAEASGMHAGQPFTAELVAYLRQALEDRAEAEMGIAHDGYLQRRLWRLVDALVEAWAGLAGTRDPVLARSVEWAVAEWWSIDPALADREGRSRLHRQQSFLDRFDVSYRIRRLQFLIRQINELEADRTIAATTVDALDAFKQRTYEFSDRCFRLRRAERLDESLLARLRAVASGTALTGTDSRLLLEGLAASLDLQALDREFDAELAALLRSDIEAHVRKTLLSDYVGFPFVDVLLLGSGSLDEGPDPLTPIRIDRISPADAHSLDSVFDGLRSRELMGFLGFFNRDYREHDYLWGRLNGAERLVDLLVEAAGEAVGDPRGLKRALFETIVAAERQRLPGCAAHLDAIAAATQRLV
jgi:patatin-related protein